MLILNIFFDDFHVGVGIIHHINHIIIWLALFFFYLLCRLIDWIGFSARNICRSICICPPVLVQTCICFRQEGISHFVMTCIQVCRYLCPVLDTPPSQNFHRGIRFCRESPSRFIIRRTCT